MNPRLRSFFGLMKPVSSYDLASPLMTSKQILWIPSHLVLQFLSYSYPAREEFHSKVYSFETHITASIINPCLYQISQPRLVMSACLVQNSLNHAIKNYISARNFLALISILCFMTVRSAYLIAFQYGMVSFRKGRECLILMWKCFQTSSNDKQDMAQRCLWLC